MDVVAIREQPERRPAKRQKIIADSEEGQRSESRMAETQVTEIRLSKTRAKPKKKANRGRVVSDISDSSLAKTNAAASTTDEEQRKEPTLRVEEGGSLAIQDEVSMEVALEPLEKRTATANLSLAPLE